MKTKRNDSIFDDKNMLEDAIMSQKYVLERYNTGVYESDNQKVKDAFMNLLLEEHQIETDLLKEIQKRDWYQLLNADEKQIKKVKEKYVTSE
jgi:spore coat protein CotF